MSLLPRPGMGQCIPPAGRAVVSIPEGRPQEQDTEWSLLAKIANGTMRVYVPPTDVRCWTFNLQGGGQEIPGYWEFDFAPLLTSGTDLFDAAGQLLDSFSNQHATFGPGDSAVQVMANATGLTASMYGTVLRLERTGVLANEPLTFVGGSNAEVAQLYMGGGYGVNLNVTPTPSTTVAPQTLHIPDGYSSISVAVVAGSPSNLQYSYDQGVSWAASNQVMNFSNPYPNVLRSVMLRTDAGTAMDVQLWGSAALPPPTVT